MNLELFNNLMKEQPVQHGSEWLIFLEICEIYLKKHKVENPIVVELGTYNNYQKIFYEQLLRAEHIGIDVKQKRHPDILGNTHDPKTLEILKEKLNERPINILFIDANHRYEHVKGDFEIYSPLCTDIVAIHDIETRRYENSRKISVWRFWDELKEKSFTVKGELENFLFLSIHQHCFDGNKWEMGIGMIIKK